MHDTYGFLKDVTLYVVARRRVLKAATAPATRATTRSCARWARTARPSCSSHVTSARSVTAASTAASPVTTTTQRRATRATGATPASIRPRPATTTLASEVCPVDAWYSYSYNVKTVKASCSVYPCARCNVAQIQLVFTNDFFFAY